MSFKLRLILCILVQLICTMNAQDDDNAQLQVTLTPHGRKSLPRGSRVEIVCEASSNFQDVEILIFKDKKRVRAAASSSSNRFTYEIQRLDNPHAGTYLCRSYANDRKNYEEVDLVLEVYDEPAQPDVCEKRCSNGRCVSRSSICNGVNDCGDWSDEAGCSSSNVISGATNDRKCEPTQETCSDGVTCKEKHWFCDGENDCADGSDEYSCPRRRPSDVCESTQFACSNRFQCISKAFVCDRSQDCPDNSDEIGCTVPKVTSPPVRTLEVCEGETITLNCAALGFPIPFINWRLNWGHVCEKPRCTMSNNDGSGVLTILKAQLSDSGAYSCEAINNQGREIYPHDAIVTVKRCNTPAPFVCNGYYVNGKCITCFCNGLLGVTCTGAGHLYYNRQAEDFLENYHDWEVKEFQTNTASKDVKTDTRMGLFTYTGPSGAWYFHVPSRFKGNRLSSYGGELRFTIYYEGEVEENAEDSQKLEVRIGGSKIGLIYVHDKAIYPHEEYEIIIPLVETSFKRYPDDTFVTRDHMLMTLANVDLIMISASFVNDQQTSSIGKFSFDMARECKDPRRSVQKMADLVEICECPSKYNGTSCESCNRGFVKGNFGTYLGTCELDCQEFCYGNSNNCDAKKCYNCENNTTGERCEACAPGFSGNGKTSRCFRRRP